MTNEKRVVREVDEIATILSRTITAEGSERHADLIALAMQKVREMSVRVVELEAERNNARALARVLAHAYESDNRPPQHMVSEALEFAVDQRKELQVSKESPK